MDALTLKRRLKLISTNLPQIKTYKTSFDPNTNIIFETEFDMASDKFIVNINPKTNKIKIHDEGFVYLNLARLLQSGSNQHWVIEPKLLKHVVHPVLKQNHCKLINKQIVAVGNIDDFDKLWTNIVSCIIQLNAYQGNHLLQLFEI